MLKSGWTVVGLGVVFLIIQSCGDDLGTGRIMTPGASAQNPEQQQPVTPADQPDAGSMEPVATEDGGWPDYEYDDGGTYWDGGAPLALDNWHWNQGVSQYRGQHGQRITMSCIPMGSEYAVWGSNPYTDDSPVCTAGAHQGIIDRSVGGQITIEMRPAQRSFGAETKNGITGLAWGPYPGSYILVR